MPAFRVGSAAIVVLGVLLVGSSGWAQTPAEARAASGGQQPSTDPQSLRQQIDQLRQDLDALQRQYADRLAALEAKLRALEGQGGPATAQPPATPEPATAQAAPPSPPQPMVPVPAGAEGAGGPSGSLPVYGVGTTSLASKIFNPDMAVVGNAVGAAGVNPVNPDPPFQLREAEVSFQAIVDPYARADFFVSVGPEGAELEEGYITFPTLPGGVLMKAGKMKAAFGKINTFHPHVLPWVDQPVAMNLLGGEEGFNDAGISVARLVPNPWLFLEATGQVFQGNSGVFTSSERGDLSYLGHVRGYQDVTEDSNLDFGVSWARGHNASGEIDGVDLGRFTTQLYGLDLTYRWRPLARSIYHSFIGRSEIIWSRRDQPDGLQSALGYFVSADYQFARRWFIGARYDRADRSAAAALMDTGQSASLTFWPSEFSQVRGQYRHAKYATGETANEFLFQFQFSIGAHGAHPF